MSSNELNHSYETNFANGGAELRHSAKQIGDAKCSSSTISGNVIDNNKNAPSVNATTAGVPGTPRAVENILISTIYRRLVSKMVETLPWLKLPENDAQYLDVRGLMHYVKQWHGGTFRRVVLSGLLDSTRKLVKTQYRIDLGYNPATAHAPSEGGPRG